MIRSIQLAALFVVAMTATAAHAQAQQLDGVIKSFAGAWNRNDEKAVASFISREGASIDGEFGRFGPLGSRQAAAVLRVLFDERTTVDVRLRQMQTVGGTPQKAYAELVWMTLAPETTQSVRVVLFVEFVQQENTWRITKIRLLP